MSIPKKIHYCWFGNADKPDTVKRCIASWKKYMPDYEIIEWNESNTDFSRNLFAREAYESKKWAFVSDYVRLFALVKIGGIYFDTDVEILKPFDDLLEHKAVAGFEEDKFVMTAILASEAEHPIFQQWLKQYDEMHFILNSNQMNITTNVHHFSELLKKNGLIPNGMRQNVKGIEVFPCEYFSPKNYYTEKVHITNNTYAIHHFQRSWCETEPVLKRFLRMHPRVQYLYYLPNRLGKKVLGKQYDALKRRLKR
ncbi:MAG: glycosyltransferase [Lachnospiraceae bacterium]|nr:glycosyltransferase [Lachnospiraceae bacterium]